MNIKGISKLAGMLDGLDDSGQLRKLKPSEQAVLWQLVAATREDQFTSFIGQAKIAKRTGLSRRSVVRAVHELQKAGLIAPRGFDDEYKVRKWSIQVGGDTSDSGVTKTTAKETKSAHSGDTSGSLSRRTKRTKRKHTEEKPLALEGGVPLGELMKKHGRLRKSLEKITTREAI